MVTLRLAHALRDCGVDVVVLAANVSADDPVVRPLASSTAVHMAFLAEHIDIFRHRGVRRDNLFKISTATAGLPLWQHPDVADADVVVLGWVNQGTVSLRGIQRLHAAFPDKHILWVMHDLWNATGICHHTVDGCDRLTGVCGACPLLHGRPHATDLSTRTQAAKKALYEAVPIRFVAVSNWLAERCRESSLMRDADISVVPNAFPVESFMPVGEVAAFPDVPQDARVIVMGAARLDDPIKTSLWPWRRSMLLRPTALSRYFSAKYAMLMPWTSCVCHTSPSDVWAWRCCRCCIDALTSCFRLRDMRRSPARLSKA